MDGTSLETLQVNISLTLKDIMPKALFESPRLACELVSWVYDTF